MIKPINIRGAIHRFLIAIILCCLIVSFQFCSKQEIRQSDEDWSFVVFGDTQQGYGVYSKLVTHMISFEPCPQLAVCCGDIMLRAGNEVEWLNFWRYSKPLTDKMPVFLVRGNHEGNDPASEEVLREQMNIAGNNFYYSYSVNDCYFIFLDSEIKGEEGSIVNDQLRWLNNQLDSVSLETIVNHIFIFLHRPIFPQGFHQNSHPNNNDELHEIFLEHPKIKIVFAGHEHMFNRLAKDGLTYIISGGAGGILNRGYGGDYHHFVKVSFYLKKNRINIKTIGIFNEIIEDFDI
ncbi:MAG: metallophosphoesterase [Bacteroidetes bacterium]|nr:metallophosphoesterase [Bacteroidota bacterium]MBL7103383.1 metallophosphoesterase [Bacteroidales bacterium]